MNGKYIWFIRFAAAAAVIALAVVCMAGCGKDTVPSGDVSTGDVVVSGAEDFGSDDSAAMDKLADYFEAFNAKDAEGLADLICSDAIIAAGQTREDAVTMMQSSIDAMAAQYGSEFHFAFDRAEFTCEDASDRVEVMNDVFSLNEAEVKIDAARYVTGTVAMVDSSGTRHEAEAGTMLVYRYNGVWYLYGYAG